MDDEQILTFISNRINDLQLRLDKRLDTLTDKIDKMSLEKEKVHNSLWDEIGKLKGSVKAYSGVFVASITGLAVMFFTHIL